MLANANFEKSEKVSYKRKRSLLSVIPQVVPSFDASDMLYLRMALQLSQPEFAMVLGTPLTTYRRWENGNATIPGAAQHLLHLIEKDKSIINEFVIVTENDKQKSLLDE